MLFLQRLEGWFWSTLRVASYTKQIVSLKGNAGLQPVINTMHVLQTSTPHLTFWGLYFIDTQDPSSYTLLKGEQVNNFKYFM